MTDSTAADTPDSDDSGPAGPVSGPVPGAVFRDVSSGRVGVVLTCGAESVRLLPLRGGEWWETTVDTLRPLSLREALSARVAVANARRTWGK